MKPKPQNLIWNTPPCCFAKFGGFTGDQQYGPPRSRHDLSLTLLTSVARRGRPVGRATESSFAQRGGAAQSGTTPHNSETQALTFSSCSHPNSYYSGPKARKERQQNRILRAGRKEYFPNRTLIGSGPAGPEIFGVLLYLYKITSPGGETSPSPVLPAGEVFKRASFSQHFAHPKRARAEPLPYITSVFAPMDSETKIYRACSYDVSRNRSYWMEHPGKRLGIGWPGGVALWD